mmetsp:Transcript_17906/g.29947  ORF Transcript_17906/g.29947 Transcript_17906/m.29947 type:complete len:276 (-) Transcript_17906:239-1066(-)
MTVEDVLLEAAAEHENEYEDEFEDIDKENENVTQPVTMSLKKAAKVVDREDEFDARASLKSATRKEEIGVIECSTESNLDESIAEKIRKADSKFDQVPDAHDRISESKVEDTESEYEDSDDDENDYEEAQEFLFCCYHRRTDAVCRHLEKGASLRTRDRHGWSPVHWACAKGFDDVLEVMLQEYRGNLKRCINGRDTLSGFTPLHLACIGGHIECVRILLDNKVKKLKNDFGELPSDVLGVTLSSASGRKIGQMLGIREAPNYDDEAKLSSRKRK